MDEPDSPLIRGVADDNEPFYEQGSDNKNIDCVAGRDTLWLLYLKIQQQLSCGIQTFIRLYTRWTIC